MNNWKFFLDQNIRYEVKNELLSLGIDTIHASDVGLNRALDSEILQFAIENNRILLTRDTDFGDMKLFPLPHNHPGIIRLQILSFIKSHEPKDIVNALAIITKNKVRIRHNKEEI